jgi:hypothetical protein
MPLNNVATRTVCLGYLNFEFTHFGRQLSIEVNLGSLVILETSELASRAFAFLIALALLINYYLHGQNYRLVLTFLRYSGLQV